MPPITALTAFLSHKYKAPTVNQFFFKLFSQNAEVQFEVDSGTSATNVTRLERLIRDADAFIGIYSHDELMNSEPAPAEMQASCRYFRLEMEIAARARKPGIVFVDKRYRGIFSAAQPLEQQDFDIQEILGRGSKPSSDIFKAAFERFCNRVQAARNYDLTQNLLGRGSTRVGVLLPGPNQNSGYSPDKTAIIMKVLEDQRFDPILMQWPAYVTPRFIEQIRALDWILLDVGLACAETGIVGFLHGAFLPAMRLLSVSSRDNTAWEASEALYKGVEVGYQKDILRWWDAESLSAGLAKRLESLKTIRKRISTLDEALEYFASAALRKEAVFISYAGADYDTAGDLRTAVRQRFQEVFDYRDGQSIRPGQPWLKEIFDRLSVSPIGIPVLSPAYLQSGNCMHELRQMIAQADDKKMLLFPVKLRKEETLSLPPELKAFQYVRLWEYAEAKDLVNWIVANLQPASPTASPANH